MKLNYYKELDGVRGIAALMVMYFHFMFDLNPGHSGLLSLIKKVSVVGQTGVTLFFVLSGFLITRILLQSKESPHYFTFFYIRRSLRIFPLYYLFLALSFFIFPLLIPGQAVTLRDTWPYWVYMQNFARTFNWHSAGPLHFWSLAVEEHFYLFWPVIVYFSTYKRLFWIIISFIVLAILCRVYLISTGNVYGISFFTFTQFDCLAIGSFLAINEVKKWVSIKQILIFTIFLAIFLSGFWVLIGGKALNTVQYFKLPVIACFYAGLISVLILYKTPLNAFFKTRILTYTGKISYGLYVYHPICFFIIHHYIAFKYILAEFAVSFLFSYIIATISYYSFENQFIKMKKLYASTKA